MIINKEDVVANGILISDIFNLLIKEGYNRTPELLDAKITTCTCSIEAKTSLKAKRIEFNHKTLERVKSICKSGINMSFDNKNLITYKGIEIKENDILRDDEIMVIVSDDIYMGLDGMYREHKIFNVYK